MILLVKLNKVLELEMMVTMKVIAVNGSPRKKWNTATLLHKALDGAKSIGAQTEFIHLYDLNFKGCTSCFACKKRAIPPRLSESL